MIGIILSLILLMGAIPSIKLLWLVDGVLVATDDIKRDFMYVKVKQHIVFWQYLVAVLWIGVACGVCLTIISQVNPNIILL